MKLMILTLSLLAIEAQAQLVSDSILVEGHYRKFHYVQPAANAPVTNLLFLLHGSGGKGQDMVKPAARLQSAAPKEKLLLVFPDGYLHFWNECRRKSNAVANLENVNEEEFFRQMIQYFKRRYKINDKRVFVAGFSGGGHMSYKLGLTMPHRFKAIGAIVANMPDSASSDCSAAGIARPVIIINGTADGTNPYNGGEMFVNNANFGIVRSTEQTFKYWASLAKYKGEPIHRFVPDSDTTDTQQLESFQFKEKGKPEIIMYKVVNGKHEYPAGMDAYETIWKFFREQQ
jgi:polyhydroxybutyrate depolymerase